VNITIGWKDSSLLGAFVSFDVFSACCEEKVIRVAKKVHCDNDIVSLDWHKCKSLHQCKNSARLSDAHLQMVQLESTS
jgi:hypothetical protein